MTQAVVFISQRYY